MHMRLRPQFRIVGALRFWPSQGEQECAVLERLDIVYDLAIKHQKVAFRQLANASSSEQDAHAPAQALKRNASRGAVFGHPRARAHGYQYDPQIGVLDQRS